MLVDTAIKLAEKAKTRKDGIYSFGIYNYVVKSSRFVAYRERPTGRIYQSLGIFDSQIGIGTINDMKRILEL